MNEGELAQFYDVHVKKLYKFFFFKLLNREYAEDLTSKTFLSFIKEIKKEQRVQNNQAFLFGIAHHVFLDFLRNKYRENTVQITEELENTLSYTDEEAPECLDIVDMLSRILNRLPEKQAIVLQLRFIDKLSVAEIAEKLGKDGNYVSTTQKRGFKSIKQLLSCTDEDTNIVENEL